MKKIIIPFEGTAYGTELPEFARLLHTRSRVLLKSVLLPELDDAHLLATAGGMSEVVEAPAEIDPDELIARNRARFKRFCEENEIDFAIRAYRSDSSLPIIRRETRFADLLLLSSVYFFGMMQDGQSISFMKDLLKGAECPVMVLAEKPWLPGELAFAYDGTASASNAIRQFAYLFPEFTRLRATLVYLCKTDSAEFPDESNLRELGSRHFKQFRVLRLTQRTDEFYDTWIRLMDNPWLIWGACSRWEWSPLFAHRFATRMIREHRVPLFIAHP